MRFVPCDTARIDLVFVESVAKMDQAGAQKMTNDGRPIWNVRALARTADEKPELLEIAVPSLTDMGDNLQPFQPMAAENLKVFAWNMEGRSGLAFSADGARTIKPKTNGAKPEPVTTGAAA